MGYDCCTTTRSFPTRAEKIDALREYQDALERELQGVKERIEDLEKDSK